MFSSATQTKPTKTTAPLDPNLGKEFIHTMQDDLAPGASARKISFSEQQKTKPQAGAPSSSNFSSSPFLSQTETMTAKENTSKNTAFESVKAPIQSAPVTPVAPPVSPAPIIPSVPSDGKKPIQNNDSPFPIQKDVEKSSSLGKFLIALIALLIVSILVLGIYYYFTNIKSPSAQNEPLPTTESAPEEPVEEEQVLITPLSEKYSYEKPNYLPIDVENSSSEEIQQVVSDTAMEISNIQTKTPFEFIVTDSNNNPIAFPIFSVASNLNLSSELLAQLEEDFSFFIHNDQGKTRAGIAIEIKNSDLALAEMLKQEPTLIENLSFLFLSKPTFSEKVVFKQGEYNGVKVRFFNLTTEDDSISIDYAVHDNKLLVATSKNAMWAIIDKIVSQKIQTETIAEELSPEMTEPVTAEIKEDVVIKKEVNKESAVYQGQGINNIAN